MNSTFYMVFVDGERTPAVCYRDPANAEQEAKRLAKLTGKKSFVLCSLKSFEVIEFKETDLRPSDLPF